MDISNSYLNFNTNQQYRKIQPPQIRRSKNDYDGNQFTWITWGKVYISYSSLYNHIRLKHPELQAAKSIPGRKRGRPALTDTEDRWKRVYQPIDPTTFFSECLKEVYSKLGKQFLLDEWGLFKSLNKYSFKETPGNPAKGIEDTALAEYHKLNYQQKSKMCLDDVLSVYLREISRKIKPKMYRSIVIFIIIFWECLNEIGWEQKLYSETLSFFDSFEKGKFNHPEDSNDIDGVKANPEIEAYKKLSNELKYWESNNAEHAPLIVNRFITEFCQKYNFGIENKFLIDYTINLWKWLNDNDHTLLQISLLYDN